MPENVDDIEHSLSIPSDIALPAMDLVEKQNQDRGDWGNPRDNEMPDVPWPEVGSPALRYLLHKFRASVEAGMDVETAATSLAVHSWFEGGVAGYDRGQVDARRPRAV
jgi:hypothetical protein